MGDVNLKIRIALLALLLAPSLGYGQALAQLIAKSLTVHGPFDPVTYKPLSGQERWHDWVREDGASPSIYVDSLGIAAYKQMINSPSEWGRTPRGYLRRTGSSLASSVIQNSIEESMAAAAGTDTRYFPCACSGVFPRTGHALKMTLLTYNHSGHLTLDIPQLSGAYGSSMIKFVWYPNSYDPLVQGVQGGHIEMGLIGAEHIVQEFAPELERLFHLRFLMHPATQ
jgi:hypothetical protein